MARMLSRCLRAARWLFPAAVLIYLGHRLTQVGWRQIWGSLPVNGAFYLLLITGFFILPTAELIIYRGLWRVGKRLRLSVLLRKQFLNGLVLEYSGESYFFLWASRNLGVPRTTLLHSIKDSSVLSAGAGLLTACLMLSTLVVTRQIRLPLRGSVSVWVCAAVALVPLLLCAVLVLGRRKVTILSGGQIGGVFVVHFARSALSQVVQYGLWSLSGALPSATACLNFVMLRMLISRVPMVPYKDLIFVGSGLAAASSLDLSVAPVAAVLVALSAGDQLLNLLLGGLPWLAGNFARASAWLPRPQALIAAADPGVGPGARQLAGIAPAVDEATEPPAFHQAVARATRRNSP